MFSSENVTGRTGPRCAISWASQGDLLPVSMGVELAHLHEMELRSWLEDRMERTRNHITLTPGTERFLLQQLTGAELFEQFLGTSSSAPSASRWRGRRGSMPLLELLIDGRAVDGVRDRHRDGPPRAPQRARERGRQAGLADLRGVPGQGRQDATPTEGTGGGDVKYHLGYSSSECSARAPDERAVQVSLAFNPSHLEWVNTVVQGRVRAQQDRFSDSRRARCLPILIHGDAAFAGQGIVAEASTCRSSTATRVGGTVHIVVNNQVGFTTSPRDASRHSTPPTWPACSRSRSST